MNLFARPPSRPRKKRGFTLIEMMMTLAIFILLAATVFGILVGTLRSTSALQDNQSHRDEMTALNAFLKKQFAGLGSQSFLVSYRRGDGEGLSQNGIAFGGTALVNVIDAKTQPNGYYLLRLAGIRIDGLSFLSGTLTGFALPSGVVSDDGGGVEWTPLIRDVRHLEWKFQDLNSDQWINQYANLSAEPNLVELTIQLAGDAGPTTMDFWLPHLWPPPTVLPQVPGVIPANGTTLPNGANPANGTSAANGANPVNGTSPANGSNFAPAPGANPANGTNPSNVTTPSNGATHSRTPSNQPGSVLDSQGNLQNRQ